MGICEWSIKKVSGARNHDPQYISGIDTILSVKMARGCVGERDERARSLLVALKLINSSSTACWFNVPKGVKFDGFAGG